MIRAAPVTPIFLARASVSTFALERYNAAMPRRVALIACLCMLLLAGAFLFLHTGARADGVCMSERFVPADGVSL